jgi:hypothetical protein
MDIMSFVINLWNSNPIVFIALVFLLLTGVIGLVVGAIGFIYANSR